MDREAGLCIVPCKSDGQSAVRGDLVGYAGRSEGERAAGRVAGTPGRKANETRTARPEMSRVTSKIVSSVGWEGSSRAPAGAPARLPMLGWRCAFER